MHLRLAGALSLFLIRRDLVDRLLFELHLLVLLLLSQQLRLQVILLIRDDHALGLTLVGLRSLLDLRLSQGLLPERGRVDQLAQVFVR